MSFDIAIYNGLCGDAYKIVNSVKAAYLYADKVRVYEYQTTGELGVQVDKLTPEEITYKYPVLKKYETAMKDLLQTQKKIDLGEAGPELVHRRDALIIELENCENELVNALVELPYYERPELTNEINRMFNSMTRFSRIKLTLLERDSSELERELSTSNAAVLSDIICKNLSAHPDDFIEKTNEYLRSDSWPPHRFIYSANSYRKMLNTFEIDLVMPNIDKGGDRNSLLDSYLNFGEKYVADTGFKIMNDVFEKSSYCSKAPSLFVPSYLSNYAISTLPGFEEAMPDEIIDIRKELDKYIAPYRTAMLQISKDIKEIPDTESLQRECLLLYLREIEPKVASINAAISDNNIFKNLAKNTITNEQTWASLGALATAFIAEQDVASVLVGAAVTLGGISIGKSVVKTIDEKKKIKDNEMFFLYQAGKKLKK